MQWSSDDDTALLRAVATGKRRKLVAEELAALFGREVTTKAVERRLYRLAERGLSMTPDATPGAIEPDIPIEWEDETVPEIAAPAHRKSVATADEPLVRRLVDLTRRKPLGLEELCDAMELSPKRVRALVDAAQADGFRIDVDGDRIGRRPHQESRDEHVVQVAGAGESHIIAVVGDIHFGNKHHLGRYFLDFCEIAYARGVRQFLHVGDILDGVYRHSIWEQSARGFEEQIGVAIRDLPRWPDATWHFIQGNHDETLGEQSGLDVGRAIEQSFHAEGRHDLKYHGARAAYLRLRSPSERRGLLVELWHPRDRANAYAKSYRLQKKIEGYVPGAKPDALFAGHWHQCIYLPSRGVHAISAGCWQGSQSSFGKSLAGSPDIGSWIVEYALTAEGTVRSFQPEWLAYFENETVREVGLG